MKKAKKAVCVILVLLLALLPGAALAADSSVCFIAVNDNLLPLTSQASSQSGQYYVPMSVFTSLRIYSSFHSGTSTAELTSSTRQMFFNVETGETYDSNNNYYTSSAIMRGGTVYVPVDFVCRQFGLSWSYIRGSGYGDVCRITDGSSSLSNEMFMAAARPLMVSRYNEYTGSSVSPDVDGGEVEAADSVIFLSFRGMPTGDTLNTLLSYGVKATFFLTAEEIRSDPSIVRRIAGEGHNIGALCSSDPAREHGEFLDALWSEAHMTSVLIASYSRDYDALCTVYAGQAGLVFCDYSIDGVRSGAGATASDIAAALSGGRSPIMYLRLQSSRTTDANLSAILSTLTNGSVVLAVSETS